MKVRIQNFQSIAETDLDVHGLTVLVGRTNIGKSALVRALTGALFNRPGDDYVRNGEKMTRVELSGVPTHGGGPLLDVVWEKGGGVNRFEVNGQKFTNVGKTAPQPLAEGGYRDLTLDQREPIRPQVAGQFQSPFLLDAPGSVVSEVLTRASRLDVLLRAGSACSRDLKSTRQLLGVRRKDLVKAETALGLIEQPIQELQARVKHVTDTAASVEGLRATRDRLALLVARRQLLSQVSALQVSSSPATALHGVTTQASRFEQLRALCAVLPVRAAVRLLVVSQRGFGDYVERAWTKGERARGLREGLQRWNQLRGVRALSLEPSVAMDTTHATLISLHVRGLRDLVPRWARLRAVPDLVPDGPVLDLETPCTTLRVLRARSVDFAAQLSQLRTAEGAFTEAGQEVEQVHDDLQNVLHAAGVCPVCQQVVA